MANASPVVPGLHRTDHTSLDASCTALTGTRAPRFYMRAALSADLIYCIEHDSKRREAENLIPREDIQAMVCAGLSHLSMVNPVWRHAVETCRTSYGRKSSRVGSNTASPSASSSAFRWIVSGLLSGTETRITTAMRMRMRRRVLMTIEYATFLLDTLPPNNSTYFLMMPVNENKVDANRGSCNSY
jgi:hypothetical protein